MAILHGFWAVKAEENYLFLWGETWRRLTEKDGGEGGEIARNPYTMTAAELSAWEEVKKRRSPSNIKKTKLKSTAAQKEIIALPTELSQDKLYPIYSGAKLSEKIGENPQKIYLYPWEIEGICLNINEAIAFLQSLPLSHIGTNDSFVSSDLRFWSHIARWSLDLLARNKFLPSLEPDSNNSFIPSWQPLIDSATDQKRLHNFAREMPISGRAYQGDLVPPLSLEDWQLKTENIPPTIPLKFSRELLHNFIDKAIDSQVRKLTAEISPTSSTSLHAVIRQWLKALARQSTQKLSAAKETQQLATLLNNWKSPLLQSQTGESLYRACFGLQAPLTGSKDWTLKYYLQAIDDPEFLVEATVIWERAVERLLLEGRQIDFPQETFLSGLGLASKLFSPIESSLQTATPDSCSITPLQAYEFIKSASWRFTDTGLGVILPPSLANREGGASRLGLSIRAQTAQLKQHQKLGLHSLLDFKWELSLGGQKITKAGFDRLVKQQSPLVEINGEWLELQPIDIQMAQAFLKGGKDKMSLSVEDALRLASGETQAIEKLPVVNFEASGQLQELLNTLTDNSSLEAIATPESFRGELRPYQLRGVSWLGFMERWGLGACLADDMGLGKCISRDAGVLVNGMLLKAEDIWEVYAQEEEFDGEGFWTRPTEKLLVNSIDEETGQIVQAPIERLYRQEVREKLRQVKLVDGSSITITGRHKLLTRDGWTRDLKVGDYVCVPAKEIWEGIPADSDLVKFVAWQIAEGYENGNTGNLTITQKDCLRLEELLETFHRIGQRYALKINNPNIKVESEKTPFLRICSQAYRQFLIAQGYEWGKRSREKSIPPFIMQADIESARLFLRHYFDGESAALCMMRSIEISSASPVLIEQLSSLLRRFGIWLRISPKQKRATNGSGIFRTYYIGTFGGNSLRRFLQEIGFTNPEKQRKLEEIAAYTCNSNVEGIPASDMVAETVKSTKLPVRHLGMHNTVYINGSQQFSRSSLEKVITNMESILAGVTEREYRQQTPSKWTAKTLEAYALLDKQKLGITRNQLQSLLDRQVFYCKIEAIEDIEYEGWVYDFQVRKHHNFVANNIICHNTIQLIAFLLHQQEEEVLEGPTLLVCPTSVLGNWEREVKKFGPSLEAMVYHGDKRPKGKDFVKAIKGKQLVITSYPLLQRDEKSLLAVDWHFVVLDEAQNIKNPEAKQSQTARKLKGSFKIALTGTPLENRLSELWSILDFLNPGYLGSRQFFQRRFATPIEKYGDTNSLQILRSLVQPFLLRRLKTDKQIIQDLPEKQENTVFCPLAKEQAVIYQKLVKEYLVDIESSEGIQRRGKILALLTKLKQICNHPLLLEKEKSSKKKTKSVINGRASGKLRRLEEMLEEVLSEGDRALIFTQFAEWGKLLQPYLEEKLGREILFLYGATRKNKREEMIDRFQNDPQGPPIMILSIKAGGTGLNLTRANHVFHFDRWWNPAVENQATDRVFRIGQTRNVQVHKFVSKGTLEEKIHDLIESKKELAEQVVGAGEQWLTELNTEELRNLLILDRQSVIDEDE